MATVLFTAVSVREPMRSGAMLAISPMANISLKRNIIIWRPPIVRESMRAQAFESPNVVGEWAQQKFSQAQAFESPNVVGEWAGSAIPGALARFTPSPVANISLKRNIIIWRPPVVRESMKAQAFESPNVAGEWVQQKFSRAQAFESPNVVGEWASARFLTKSSVANLVSPVRLLNTTVSRSQPGFTWS